MRWLGLDYDEGPIYQMQRLDRYREVIARCWQEGTAYRCYCTPRNSTRCARRSARAARRPRYDGRWRPSPGKVLPPVPAACSR
jgi:glutamyl-tRNA synthetase